MKQPVKATYIHGQIRQFTLPMKHIYICPIYINMTKIRLLRLRGVITRALPETSMCAIYRMPKICKFPHL